MDIDTSNVAEIRSVNIYVFIWCIHHVYELSALPNGWYTDYFLDTTHGQNEWLGIWYTSISWMKHMT